MTSLPQGWHSAQKENSASFNSSAVPISRKKWNSPVSSSMPRSKLPSYKRSIPSLPNGYHNKLSLPISGAKTCKTPQGKLPLGPTKASALKDYQTETINYRKELSTVKAENSILKAKVRRVDDENNQKSRQIEKLQEEIKSLQKNHSASNKRNKDYESVLLLRQKCLRLEGVVKEKDVILKKFAHDLKLIKTEDIKEHVEKFCKEIGNHDASKGDKLVPANAPAKPSSSTPARTSLSRVSMSSKSEVTKLRDILHKLQGENRDLLLQLKDKEQEIRRLKTQIQRPMSSDLKIHLPSVKPNKVKAIKESKEKATESTEFQRRTPRIMTNQSVAPLPSPKPLTRNVKPILTKLPDTKLNTTILNSTPTFQPKHPLTPNLNRTSPKKTLNAQNAYMKSPLAISQQSVPKLQKKSSSLAFSRHTASKPNSTFVIAKSKSPPRAKASRGNVLSTNASLENDIDDKVQGMRENRAARKIQRSWRESHTTTEPVKNEDSPDESQAITFVATALKHHKMRKENLNVLSSKESQSFELKIEEELAIMQAVLDKIRVLWDH